MCGMNINVKEETFRAGLHSAGKLGSVMRVRGAYMTANESACKRNGISTDLVLCRVLFVMSRCTDELIKTWTIDRTFAKVLPRLQSLWQLYLHSCLYHSSLKWRVLRTHSHSQIRSALKRPRSHPEI